MKHFDDDMDELFNKAGRQYPLKTEPKNWDAVRAALQGEQDGAVASASQGKKYRRYLPLLLLLLIPAVYVFLDKENVKTSDGADSAVTKEQPAVTNSTGRVKTTNEKPSDDNSNTQEGGTKEIEKAPDATGTANEIERSDAEIKEVNGQKEAERKSLHVEAQKDRVNKDGEKERVGIARTNDRINTNNTIAQQPISLDRKQSVSKNTNDPRELTPTINTPGEPSAWSAIPSLKAGNSPDRPSGVISLNAKGRSLRTLVQPNGSVSVPNSDKKRKNISGLYYGLLAGPDASTIKGQKVKGLGYSAGIVAGYNLNAHWAIEGGFLWSKKKYFTDGKHFDKEGPGIPWNVTVHWLDGGCEMFDFPISVRYSFSAKRNSFFGTAGLTSYIMKKEDYDYAASSGVGGWYKGYHEYDRSGDHLFANLQLSAGYKFGITPKMNIRIEPYLKAPLKKIGIGKMPVTSTGLFFAITRDLR